MIMIKYICNHLNIVGKCPLALPLSTVDDQALVPVGMSNLLATSYSDVPKDRALKIYRIKYEQANAALETPSAYQDSIASPQSKMWSDAIKTKLKVLEENETWTEMEKPSN